MDLQDILRSTLAVVGGDESVQQLNKLIECRNIQKRNVTTLQNSAQVIEEQKRLNERLKEVIDAMKQREEIEKQIEICAKKKKKIDIAKVEIRKLEKKRLDAVIKEYEDREREITRLRTEVETSNDSNKLLEKKMENIKSKWLPPLVALLRDINKSFAEMLSKLGCNGEIKLEKGGSEEDFDKYGISILVRFREDAPSGGEFALCTALYLLALQRQVTVPFRCVDGINQGINPINERKMFELLVKVTTECDNAQYFLLTTKLLTNLEYNDKITVHTIMNGKKIIHYKNWNHIRFVQKAKIYKAVTS